MGRRPCCSKQGLNRGLWSFKEDRILINYIEVHGEGKWRDLPQRAGLKRCGKSCRLRWLNYLKPDIKRGNISKEEEELIVKLHKLLGNRWSLIAGRLPGRTDNEIKNYWNSNLSKRFHGNKDPQRVNKQFVDQIKEVSPKEKPEFGHQVIRTKANRCTKVVNIPEILTPLAINKNNAAEINTYRAEGTPLSSLGSRDDFLMDFEIGNLLLPDFLSSNQVNYEMNTPENCDHMSPSLDLPGLENNDKFELLEEDIARASSCGPLESNCPSCDLESLKMFLSEDERP